MTDARILMELDQLYKRLNCSHEDRLAFLEKHKDIAFQRDDLYLEYVTLLNQLGQYEEAIRMPVSSIRGKGEKARSRHNPSWLV